MDLTISYEKFWSNLDAYRLGGVSNCILATIHQFLTGTMMSCLSSTVPEV